MLSAVSLVPSYGVLVTVQFTDVAYQLPDGSLAGGPKWTGVVDTLADTLQILTWEELPASGPAFWTPLIPDLSAGPLIWEARRVDPTGQVLEGIRFDVPDSFGANGVVSIGQDWGFVSLTSANNMDWVDGDYFNVVDYFPGWGAQVRQPSQGVFVLKTGAEPGDQSPYDETTLPVWPYDLSGFGVRVVLDAEVVVLDDIAGTVIPIPEVSAALPLAMIAGWRWAAPRRRPTRSS